jgi:hypothetical protein
MSGSVMALALVYRKRFLTDPVFHARVKLAERILTDLREQGALGGGLLYAALAVMGANEQGLPNDKAEAWERGMTDAKLLAAGIRTNIKNPYKEES